MAVKLLAKLTEATPTISPFRSRIGFDDQVGPGAGGVAGRQTGVGYGGGTTWLARLQPIGPAVRVGNVSCVGM